MTLVVRTTGDPAALVAAVKAAVGELDRSLPLVEVATLDDLLDRRTVARRFNAWLLSGFSTAAMALTAVGLYGLLAYLVILRRREFAVRLALGASLRGIVRLVVLQGVRLTVPGAVLGTLAAWLAARWMRSLLPDVGPADPAISAAVGGLAAAATIGASLWPARRAARVDPVTALRSE
jgi:putative ABC transport system permease protein